MDEITFGNIIKYTSLIAGILGLLVSLDLLAGAGVLKVLKRILDRSFDLDKLIIKVGVFFRRILDSIVNFDEKIITTKARVIWGFVILIISVVMVSLVIINR